MGRWGGQKMQRKSSRSMELHTPVSNTAIEWSHKGLAQKQLALLSVWLREALAHKNSKAKTVDLGNNPHLGRFDTKEELSTVVVLAHRQSKANLDALAVKEELSTVTALASRRSKVNPDVLAVIVGDKEITPSEIKKIVGSDPSVAQLLRELHEKLGMTDADIEAKVLALPSMQGQKHGLDTALSKVARCKPSAQKVEVLKLNNCGLTDMRLVALAQAIRPDKETRDGLSELYSDGLRHLSELYLHDNAQLVRETPKNGGWEKLCRSVAKTLPQKAVGPDGKRQENFSILSLANCQLSRVSMEMLTKRLLNETSGGQSKESDTSPRAGKPTGKPKKRMMTIDISDNASLGSDGGEVVADAFVVAEQGFPVEDLVVGCSDERFLTDQGAEIPNRTNEDADDPRTQMWAESCTLPLERLRQLQYKNRFRPAGQLDGAGQPTGGCEFNFECKKINPAIAWIFGEWLTVRNTLFPANADMLVSTIKLKGNPLTGSKPRHKKQAVESGGGRKRQESMSPKMSSRMSPKSGRAPLGRTRSHMRSSPKKPAALLYAGDLELWNITASEDELYETGHGSCVDADSAGFGKLCEAFGLPTITNVDVSYCGLGAEAMREMTKPKHNTGNDVPWLKTANLRSLNLSFNPIGVVGREHLKDALRDADIEELIVDMGGVPKTLTASQATLDFAETHDLMPRLMPEDIIIVAGWITAGSVKKNLTSLNISGNHIITKDSDGFKDLMEGIPFSCITKLDIKDVGLDPIAAKQVAAMVTTCSEMSKDLKQKRVSLKELDISGNTFATDTANGGAGAWREFCVALGTSTLEKMAFGDMGLDAGLVDFLRAAVGNMKSTQIKSINILGNPAAESDKVLEDLRGANTALQHKLIFTEAQMLALNDNTGQSARYLDHLKPENQRPIKTKTEMRADADALAVTMGRLKSDPYDTVRSRPNPAACFFVCFCFLFFLLFLFCSCCCFC